MKFEKFHIRVFTLMLLLAIIGCSGNAARMSGSEGSSELIDNIPIEEWMDQRCGKCHNEVEYHGLFIKMKSMSDQEFEDSLAGMVHDDIQISDSELNKVLTYFQNRKLIIETNKLQTRNP